MDHANVDIISQRSIAGGPVFQFKESHLKYSGIEWDLNAKYEDIVGPSQYRRIRTQVRLFKFLPFLLITFGSAVLMYNFQPHHSAESFQWFVYEIVELAIFTLGVCLPLHFLYVKDFTVIPSRNGNVLVARGKHHDAVIEKLQALRLKRLRSFAEPDLANSPEEELAKLKWLHDEGAITEQEYSLRCSQVTVSNDKGWRASSA